MFKCRDIQWNLLIRTSSFVLCREVVLALSEVIFYSVYVMSTFGLSFAGRFVLFRSVLYRRFHCIIIRFSI